MQQAWEDLFDRLKIKTHEQLAIPREIRVLDACGYWIGKGLLAGKMSVRGSRPRGIQKNSIWLDRDSNRFFVHQASINYILEKFNAPPWDVSQVQSAIEGDAYFYGAERVGRSIIWRLSHLLLAPAAQSTLRALGKVPSVTGQSQPLPELAVEAALQDMPTAELA